MIGPYEGQPGAAGEQLQQDFARMVDLQQAHSAASLALDTIEMQMSSAALNASLEFTADYVVHQEHLAELETNIKSIFARNPHWREGDKKSVKTPYGEVAQRTVTELEIPNALMTVALIEAQGKVDPAFKATTFLRVEVEPNVEALEALSDEALAKLGVRRVKSERVTVKALKVKAAQVVKAAEKKAAKK